MGAAGWRSLAIGVLEALLLSSCPTDDGSISTEETTGFTDFRGSILILFEGLRLRD